MNVLSGANWCKNTACSAEAPVNWWKKWKFEMGGKNGRFWLTPPLSCNCYMHMIYQLVHGKEH